VAVHLLLSFPLFVVVVAVDARGCRALSKQYPNLLAETRTPTMRAQNGAAVTEPASDDLPLGASSRDYMEKIFQIPYWVRSMNPGAAERYVRSIASRDVAIAGGSVRPVAKDQTADASGSPSTDPASGANGASPRASGR
jgi:hypothetical protein